MSDQDPTTRGLSRRTIVRTGAHTAWAAPVILAASTAPAFAASGLGDFTINRGTSNYQYDGFNAYVFFGGFSVIADGPAIEANTLQMSITTSGNGSNHTLNNNPGAQWTATSSLPQATHTWVYSAAVSGAMGAPNFFSAVVATFQSDQTTPTFTVQITHPDYSTAIDVYTPPARRSARTTTPPAGVKLPSQPN
jgi:hypothetical protein